MKPYYKKRNYIIQRAASACALKAIRPVAGSDVAVESVAEAFLLAKALYGADGSPVIFTKRAEESALRSPFQRPKDVFRYLDHLAIFAGRLVDQNGALGMSYADYFKSVGLSYRSCVSQTAEGLYREEYATMHEGRCYKSNHHFTLGAKNPNCCLSIHFDVDPKTKRVVITHCGRHLSNTRS